MSDVSDEALLREFTERAVTWDSPVGADAKKANRIFDRLHALAKDLNPAPTGAIEPRNGDSTRFPSPAGLQRLPVTPLN